MLTAIALSLALQDGSVVRDKWDDVAKLWKDVGSVVAGAKAPKDAAALDDAFLEAAGRLHSLFKDAKDAESLAVKGALKARLLHAIKLLAPEDEGGMMRGRIRVVVKGMQEPDEDEKVDLSKELAELEKSYEKLGGEEGEKLAKKAVESLEKVKALPELEGWQKRTLAKVLRALEAGKAHPMKDAPAPTAETKARLAELVAKLGDAEQTARDEAEQKIVAMGDGIVPLLKEHLKAAEDAEIRSRLKRILGVK
jgi:hypothetical protein